MPVGAALEHGTHRLAPLAIQPPVAVDVIFAELMLMNWLAKFSAYSAALWAMEPRYWLRVARWSKRPTLEARTMETERMTKTINTIASVAMPCWRPGTRPDVFRERGDRFNLTSKHSNCRRGHTLGDCGRKANAVRPNLYSCINSSNNVLVGADESPLKPNLHVA